MSEKVARRTVGRPLTAGPDGTAAAAANARWERERQDRAERFASLNGPEQEREIRTVMRELGLSTARELTGLSDDDRITLLKAVVLDSLLVIVSGAVKPKTPAEAMKVAESAFKMLRLEQGKATEILDDEDELRARTKAIMQRVRDNRAS